MISIRIKSIVLGALPLIVAVTCLSCTKGSVRDVTFDHCGLIPSDVLEGYRLEQCNRDYMYRIDNCTNRETFAVLLSTLIYGHSEFRLSFYGTPELYNSKENLEFRYLNERLGKIQKAVQEDPDFLKSYIGPCYVDAGVISEIKVFADKSLFGRAPGEDLSDHIILHQTSQNTRIIASFPDIDFIGKAEPGMRINEYFKVGSIMPNGPCIASFVFDEIPSDIPSDFMLTFEIPLDLNDSWAEFPFAIIGPDWVKPEDTFVYRPSVQIHLD